MAKLTKVMSTKNKNVSSNMSSKIKAQKEAKRLDDIGKHECHFVCDICECVYPVKLNRRVAKRHLANECAKANLKGYKRGLRQKKFDLDMELSRQKKEIMEELEKMRKEPNVEEAKNVVRLNEGNVTLREVLDFQYLENSGYNKALDQAIKAIKERK